MISCTGHVSRTVPRVPTPIRQGSRRSSCMVEISLSFSPPFPLSVSIHLIIRTHRACGIISRVSSLVRSSCSSSHYHHRSISLVIVLQMRMRSITSTGRVEQAWFATVGRRDRDVARGMRMAPVAGDMIVCRERKHRWHATVVVLGSRGCSCAGRGGLCMIVSSRGGVRQSCSSACAAGGGLVSCTTFGEADSGEGNMILEEVSF